MSADLEKVVLVRLGRAAGKVKYAMLDKDDASLLCDYSLEARLEVDRDGNGARVLAWAYDGRRFAGRYLHDIVWESHRGALPPNHLIVHANGIAVDNRLANLNLEVAGGNGRNKSKRSENEEGSGEGSVYWKAIRNISSNSLLDVAPGYLYTLYGCELSYSTDGDADSFADGCPLFFECHNPPCSAIERDLRQFNACGRCRRVRYCGRPCQQMDWSSHSQFCHVPHALLTIEPQPER